MGWLRHIWVGCLFRWLTGIPCPACGTTRAIILALRGEWLLSLRMNPYGILTLLILLGANIWVFWDLWHHSDTLTPSMHRLDFFLKRHWWLILLIVLVAATLWGLRLHQVVLSRVL